ncbi:tetratricopeptide repeat protein [candidate division WOR-3 bacterium]|nr:tetratricopeptide repeat protein [candidate division WOR-3 bacterium]
MPIKGSLSDLSIMDILQMLYIGSKTGELAITNEENLVYLYLNTGNLTHIHWMNRKDRLGSLLVENGFIEEKDLKEVLELQQERENIPLGELILELELVDKKTLTEYIKKQMRDAIIELSGWAKGYFVFESREAYQPEGLPVSIKIDDVLLESAALKDELAASSLPDKDSILVVSPDWSDESSLTEEEQMIINKVDGEKTLSSLINVLPMEEFKALKLLSALIKKGALKELEIKRETLVKDKEKIEEHMNLGIAFVKIGMLNEAQREFNRILELKPNNPEALFYKGIIGFKLNDLDEAENAFKESLKTVKRTSTLNNIYLINELKGNNESALDYLSKALKREENNEKILLNKAIIYLKMKKDAEALNILDNIKTKTPYTIFYYSYILARKGKIKEAMQILEEGLSLAPEFGEYFFNLGKLYETIGEEKKATEMYQQGLKSDPECIILSKALIDYYYRNKLFDICEVRIETLISTGIRDWDLFFKKGNILFQRGNTKEALELWKKALELNPDNKLIKRTIELAKGNEEF